MTKKAKPKKKAYTFQDVMRGKRTADRIAEAEKALVKGKGKKK